VVDAVPFVVHDSPSESVGWADGVDAVVVALVDFFFDLELFDEVRGVGVCGGAVDADLLQTQASGRLGCERP
jgi:hypothetical protein